MTTDLPAMRRFKNALVDGLANAPDVPPTAGDLVADVEAEGSALIGAVPCPDDLPHGVVYASDPEGFVRDVFRQPCPACGAVV